MAERSISETEVAEVLQAGQSIEDYPNDVPYPSRLVMAYIKERPLHVVAAWNEEDYETIVVTVYEPDPKRWDETFTRRRPG